MGLFGVCFDPPLYAERLAERLGMPILLRHLDDIGHPLLAKSLAEEGITGGLFVLPEPDPVAWIVVPRSLWPMEAILSQFHELGHLAAGHGIPARRILNPECHLEGSTWHPPERLATTPLPETDEACEREAERRAEYAILAGLYGERIFARYAWSLDKDPPAEGSMGGWRQGA